MAKQTPTPGTCRICEEPVTKRTIVSHLLKKHKGESGKNLFLIMVDTPYSSPYWLALVVDPEAYLQDLDSLLRDVWVECCGHLSSFIILGIEYSAGGDGEEIDDDDYESKSMKIKVKKVIGPGITFKYEYDFGTTTELRLKVVDTIVCMKPKEKIMVVGMNTMPETSCDECGRPALYHYNECEEKLLCKSCAADEELDECYLLPITNSPRTGLCGYEGGTYDTLPDDKN
jgi:hypothetical protein